MAADSKTYGLISGVYEQHMSTKYDKSHNRAMQKEPVSPQKLDGQCTITSFDGLTGTRLTRR